MRLLLRAALAPSGRDAFREPAPHEVRRLGRDVAHEAAVHEQEVPAEFLADRRGVSLPHAALDREALRGHEALRSLPVGVDAGSYGVSYVRVAEALARRFLPL